MRCGGRVGGGVSEGGGWTEQSFGAGGAAGQAPREGSRLPIPNERNGWLEGARHPQQHEREARMRPYRESRLRPVPSGPLRDRNPLTGRCPRCIRGAEPSIDQSRCGLEGPERPERPRSGVYVPYAPRRRGLRQPNRTFLGENGQVQ
jgi:hypothetical protein